MDRFSTPMLTGVAITTAVTTISVNGTMAIMIAGGVEAITGEDIAGIDKG